MASAAKSTAALLLFLLCSSLSFSFHVVAAEEKRLTYIVHMAKSKMPATFAEHGHWYDASLRSVSDSAEVLYSYDTVVHGFSTRLTRAEAQALESIDGVLYVLPEVRYELHTTRTPELLGLDKIDGLGPQANTASDVVVGVLDTMLLLHKSFMSNPISHTALTNLLLICWLVKNGKPMRRPAEHRLARLYALQCQIPAAVSGSTPSLGGPVPPLARPIPLCSSSPLSPPPLPAPPAFPPSLPLLLIH